MNHFDNDLSRGEELFQSGKLEEARIFFEQIIQANPQHYEAMNNLGTVFYEQGDILAAEKHYQKAFSLKGDDVDVLSNLADLYINLKRWEDAISFLEHYLHQLPQDYNRLNQLALAYMESGEHEQAIPILERSLEIQPAQESIRNVLKTLQSMAPVTHSSRGPSPRPLLSVGLPVYNGGKYPAEARKAMRFSICSIEPEGFKFAHFLYDICKYLCFAIESAGHECCIVRNQLFPDRINVILGAHRLTDPANVEQMTRAGRYVLFQSEIVGEDTINNWPVQKSFAAVYLPLMRQAMVVWDRLESNVIRLKQLGIDAELFPNIGYLPALEEVVHKKKKDIDFLFYGSLTPHRARMIEELRRRGGNVVSVFDNTAMFRNDLIARARVNLAPKQGPEMSHFCENRVLYLLNNRSIVVVERCHNQEWIEHCFPSADTEKWADLCIETLNRPDLDRVADEYFERFKKIRTVDQIQSLIERLRLGMCDGTRSKRLGKEPKPALPGKIVQIEESLFIRGLTRNYNYRSPDE